MATEKLIRGLKEIAAFLQLRKMNTVREWEEKYHLPIRRDPANRVYAIESELIEWLILYDIERRKYKTKQVPRGAVKQLMELKKARREAIIDG